MLFPFNAGRADRLPGTEWNLRGGRSGPQARPPQAADGGRSPPETARRAVGLRPYACPFCSPAEDRRPFGMRGADRTPGNEWNLRGGRSGPQARPPQAADGGRSPPETARRAVGLRPYACPFCSPAEDRRPLGMRGADRPPGNGRNLRSERAAGPAAAGGRRRAKPAGNRPEGGWPAAVCLPRPEYKPSEQRRPLSCLFCSKMSLPPWHATRNL